ncbi:hypothetical protein BIW11_05704 [Tropilaelaps mercedesae]|uniref:Uncharacterized protein n=1 Tax=Tropilaelaps mercedesae TaxID=418985 RepID=A0A1V9Y1B0_9ACAR|nr:hypothetical protein BIW11_05704 [Tropilaelaps mercedesae]
MSQKNQPTATCKGTGLIKKLTINRRGEMKGTLRMLTPIENRGKLCTFFVRDVKVPEEELDYVQIGMTLQYYYSGNEANGYRATQLKLIEVADYSAFVIKVPTTSSNAALNASWTGLMVSLDLTLDTVKISADSLRALFTHADTGEVEPCTIQPGDRCLVQIKSKEWIQANMRNKEAEWQIISFLPSNTTDYNPRACNLEVQPEPPMTKENETQHESSEGKQKSDDGPVSSFNYCSSSAVTSSDTPPSELSPQHNLQQDETMVSQGAKACSFPEVDGWQHPAPARSQPKSIGQTDYGLCQRDIYAECNYHCRHRRGKVDNSVAYSRRPECSVDKDCPLHLQAQPLTGFPSAEFDHQEKFANLPATCCDKARCKGRTLGHLRNGYVRKTPLRATSDDDDGDDEGDEDDEVPPMVPITGALYGPGAPPFLWVPMHDASMCDTIEARTMAAASFGHRPVNSFFPVAHPRPSLNFSPRAVPFGAHLPHAYSQFWGKPVIQPMRPDESVSNHQSTRADINR